MAAVKVVNSAAIAFTCVTSVTVVYDSEVANVAAVVVISPVTLVNGVAVAFVNIAAVAMIIQLQ